MGNVTDPIDLYAKSRYLLDVHRRMAEHAIPLSERGVEQAREAGRHLDRYLEHVQERPSAESLVPARRPVIRLWTSPYRRPRQTADALQETAGSWITDRREHVLFHGVTLRAFVMMWCHLTPEWFEDEPNPGNCAIRLLEDGRDRGYLFEGFPRSG